MRSSVRIQRKNSHLCYGRLPGRDCMNGFEWKDLEVRQEDLEILCEQNDFSKGVKSKHLKDSLGDKN